MVGLIALWWWGMRGRGLGAMSAITELCCLVILGVGLGQPGPLLGPLYGATCLRCLYGTNLAAGLRVLGYLAACESVALIRPPADEVQRADVLWTWVLPTLILTTVAVRTLVIVLERLTTARDLSARLAHTAHDLLTASSPDAVRALVESCARQVVPQDSEIRLETTWDDSRVASENAITLPMEEDGRRHGRLVITPAGPVSQQQTELLRTLAAQATAAFEAAQLRAMLTHRANHDALTGLPNRTLFRDVLAGALSRPDHTVAILFVDIDDFKIVNDALGHPAGDTLLIEVAKRLLTCLRPGDVAARMGGDEFAILLDNVDPDEPVAVAKRLLAALDEPFHLEHRLFNVHCSIGIAQAKANPTRAVELAAELIRDSDMAMYVAKTRGKNRYEWFTSAMAAAVTHDRGVRDQLSSALANGELELHYQPIVSLTDGSIVTVEALVRWQHPQRGLLMPCDFLPQAVKVGLMPDIERWVVAIACRDAVGWPGATPPAVAVNISPEHLARSWLVPVIKQALKKSGLPGERLVVEITEESAVLEPAAAAANLRECVALGVRVAMDDFGAGHASLRHIGALPITTVKIDRSLVSHETGPLVIRSVVGLAHALGLKVVAEGIEAAEQLEWLRDSDCDAVQGFLLARPSPLETLSLRPRPVTPQ
jgi:diguanylate cyclase (GGDEF)-like protein